VFQNDEVFPARWRSLLSGTTKTLRRDGDHIYIETLLPEDLRQAGCFSLAELQKLGDTYAGTARESCVWQYQKRLIIGYETGAKRYQHEWPIWLTSVTAKRVEGWSMK
jgi:hypothetical protein